MSLRLRLTLTLGAAFVLLWSVAATWMLFDVRNQLMLSLDQRLAASARMVAGLLVQLPQPQLDEGGITRLSAEQLGIENGLACQVSSLRGEVLARSHAAPDSVLDAQRTGFHDQLIGDTAWRSFTMIRDGMRITTADRLDERATLKRSVLLAAALPVLVALLGSLVVLWIGLGKGLSPLRRIRTALAQRSVDSVEPLHVERLPPELVPLVETQNQLFARIAQTLERERRLTDDAAHELRSPLTAIKTHLQVAAMTEGDTARRALALAEIGTDRLHRTLEQLLMLARVEGLVSFDDGLRCTAAEVAQQAIADACQQPGPCIDLNVAADVPLRALAMPPALAIAALRNLLDNARRHTRPESHVQLSLEQLAEDKVCFRVADHGPAIAAQQVERFTERFWRNSEGDGSGLGLSIVKAIAERCGCELRFTVHGDGLRVELIAGLQEIPLDGTARLNDRPAQPPME
ncbi:ATP-binding protein [Stutzerimonas zhaodongensis]|uniref:histidine kinase n=1 Tax=Stutzerimonas zhaodongensis TaxID=1176257 RepID=A0A365PQB6_9GAMM|nr:ATP-binding protein [Stutzerimonas zhaodongensis]QWV17073.1 sensor histidine kinase N-terminal domain-containing protein [Stutzerimonas zhaodongensis]RBA53556.1 two-component sensor histidine kinase [Stutzerimonas zhaodongensis]